MDMLRFLGLAALMFAAAFLGMNWFLRIEPLKPDPRLPTFERLESKSAAAAPGQSSISDGDATRDRLRHEVLDYAKALSDDPCNPTVKRYYIKAVVAYARAWLSIAPCVATRTCGSSDSQKLERAPSVRLATRCAGPRRHGPRPRQGHFRPGGFPQGHGPARCGARGGRLDQFGGRYSGVSAR